MKTVGSMFMLFAVAFFPAIARACPSCYAASSARTVAAYYASTMLLSLMPFFAIGGVVLGAYLMRNRPARADAKSRQ